MNQKKIFIPPKVRHYNFCPDKDWVLYYSFLNPYTGKMELFRSIKGLTKSVPVVIRKQTAQTLLDNLRVKLSQGYNPFDQKYKIPDEEIEENKSSRFLLVNDCNWGNCLNKFIEFKWTENIEVDSIRAYECKIRKFLSYLAQKGMTNNHIKLFTFENACDFMMWLHEEAGCKSSKTLREYRFFMSNAAKWLIHQRLLTENVFELLPLYKSTPKKPKMFTNNQLHILKDYFLEKEPQMWAICQFVLYCFFRPNKEVRLMKIKQIDFERGVLYSDENTSKNNKSQAVIIPSHFLEFLKQMEYDKASPNDFVFTIDGHPGSIPIGKNYIHKRFNTLKNIFDIDTYFYALKHTGNRKLKDAKLDIIDIMKQNRHSNPNQTYEYMRTLEDDFNDQIRNKFFVI